MNIKVLASGSSGNAYYVSDGKTPLLLEAGIPFKEIQQGLDFKVSQLAGCLISHEHGDHAKAVKDIMEAGIDCYMSLGTAEALKLEGHRLHIIEALKQFQLGTWIIKPFVTVHNGAEPLGFLMASQGEKLLFATDTVYISPRFKGLTHIMVEANYSLALLRANTESPELRRLIIQNHMALDTLVNMLRVNNLSKVQEIWLLHLSDNNADAKMFKQRVERTTGKMVFIGGERWKNCY